MSKAVLISVQPQWCQLIASGKKTIEVRKTRPKLGTPFKCYIYCTYGEGLMEYKDEVLPNVLIGCRVSANKIYGNCCNGKVIGEFICDSIRSEYEVADGLVDVVLEMQSCVDCSALIEYSGGKELYSWNISNLKIYDEPKELSEFKKHNRKCHYEHLGLATPKCSECKECQLDRPPQSWCYVEEV